VRIGADACQRRGEGVKREISVREKAIAALEDYSFNLPQGVHGGLSYVFGG
jgi:hypothetical protein